MNTTVNNSDIQRFNDTNTTVYKANVNATTSDIEAWEFGSDCVLLTLLIYLTICDVIAAAKFGNEGKSKSTAMVLMTVSSILAGIIASSACIVNIVGYFLLYTPVTFSIKAAFTLLPLTAIYQVLWFRQSIFYSNPILKKLTPLFARRLRIFQGFFIPGGAVLLVLLIVQQSLKNNCIVLQCVPNWVLVLMVVAQLEVQVITLGLFIHPLWKHHRMMVSDAHGRSPNYLMKVVKRTTIITIVAILTDSATLVIFLIWKSGTVYNFNLVLNMVCIKFCFTDWRRRLLPCEIVCEETRNISDTTSGRNTATSINNVSSRQPETN